MSNLYTLKLDASYRPIEVVDCFKGFSLVFSGRARVLEFHTQKACALFSFPSVVVLNSYIRKREFVVSATRNTIFQRDNYCCQYCGDKVPKNKLTVDHVIPKSRGGQKSWNNLVACCTRCNQKKANLTPSEACMELLNQPTQPKNNLWSDPQWIMSRGGIKEPPREWKKYFGE